MTVVRHRPPAPPGPDARPRAARLRSRRMVGRQRPPHARTSSRPGSASTVEAYAGPETGQRDRVSYVLRAGRHPLRRDERARRRSRTSRTTCAATATVCASSRTASTTRAKRTHARSPRWRERAGAASTATTTASWSSVRSARTATPSTRSSSATSTTASFLPGFEPAAQPTSVGAPVGLTRFDHVVANVEDGDLDRVGRVVRRSVGPRPAPALRRGSDLDRVLRTAIDGGVERRSRRAADQRARAPGCAEPDRRVPRLLRQPGRATPRAAHRRHRQRRSPRCATVASVCCTCPPTTTTRRRARMADLDVELPWDAARRARHSRRPRRPTATSSRSSPSPVASRPTAFLEIIQREAPAGSARATSRRCSCRSRPSRRAREPLIAWRTRSRSPASPISRSPTSRSVSAGARAGNRVPSWRSATTRSTSTRWSRTSTRASPPTSSPAERSTTSSRWAGTRGVTCAHASRRTLGRPASRRRRRAARARRCYSRSRSATTSTCTRASTTRPTSAASSGPRASRCCRTGGTSPSATTAGPGRSSCRAPRWSRPCGQLRVATGSASGQPSAQLDIELELAFVVGVPSRLGEPVADRRRRRARLRDGAPERLVGARHPGLRVPAARPVPREVVRDLGVAVARPVRRARHRRWSGACPRRSIRRRPRISGSDRPWIPPLQLGGRARIGCDASGPATARCRVPRRGRRSAVLVAGAADRARDLERRVVAHR